MHAICAGVISFGFVTIPVKLYAGIRNSTPHFRQIHAACGSRIGLVRRCATCAREVPLEEIERAHEVARDDYVVLTKEELDLAAGGEPAGTISLTHVVAPEEVDLSYIDKSYWVAPAGATTRAFALLCETLIACRRVAIVTAKLRTRTRTAMLRPRDGILSLAMLHFSDEIVSADALPVPAAPPIGDSERKLALDLVGQLAAHFDPKGYPNPYPRNIEATVERKVGQGLARRGGAQKQALSSTPANQVVDLTELLAKSVRAAGRPALAKAKRRKEKPASRKGDAT
jgi:DNA end-binding protein Ku